MDFLAREEQKGWAGGPKGRRGRGSRPKEGKRCGLREGESNTWAEKGPRTREGF